MRKRYAPPEPFRLGDLTIDYEQRRVTVAERAVKLMATEYDLLRVPSINAGRVTTLDSLLRQVFGDRQSGSILLLRAFVKRLRRELGDDAASPAYIFNERQIGYRMPRPDNL